MKKITEALGVSEEEFAEDSSVGVHMVYKLLMIKEFGTSDLIKEIEAKEISERRKILMAFNCGHAAEKARALFSRADRLAGEELASMKGSKVTVVHPSDIPDDVKEQIVSLLQKKGEGGDAK